MTRLARKQCHAQRVVIVGRLSGNKGRGLLQTQSNFLTWISGQAFTTGASKHMHKINQEEECTQLHLEHKQSCMHLGHCKSRGGNLIYSQPNTLQPKYCRGAAHEYLVLLEVASGRGEYKLTTPAGSDKNRALDV